MSNEIISKEALISSETEPFNPPATSPHTQGMRFMVPAKNRIAMGLVVYVSGLGHSLSTQYMALAILPGWICLCDEAGLREYIPMDEINRLKVTDLSGIRIPVPDPEGQPVYITKRSAKGLSMEVVRDDNFVDELIVATMHPNQAYEWQREISRAIQSYKRGDAGTGIIT